MQLGVIVNDLDYHQEAMMLLVQVANLCQKIDHTCVIFHKEVKPPYLIPMCAVMNISEIYSFRGLLLVTTLENLRLAKKVSRMSKDILYYPMDLEWLRGEKNFIENYKLLNTTKVVAQNQYHYDAIFKYSGVRPNFIVENFDLRKIIGMYESQIR